MLVRSLSGVDRNDAMTQIRQVNQLPSYPASGLFAAITLSFRRDGKSSSSRILFIGAEFEMQTSEQSNFLRAEAELLLEQVGS